MKKIVLALTMFICASTYANELSVCDGRFESGQRAHVVIDWDNNSVFVNNLKTYIQSVISYGVITGSYMNKLNIETFSIIGYFKNAGAFVAQQQVQYGQITFTNFARLSCSKSFYKPFTDRMLDH